MIVLALGTYKILLKEKCIARRRRKKNISELEIPSETLFSDVFWSQNRQTFPPRKISACGGPKSMSKRVMHRNLKSPPAMGEGLQIR